MKALTIWQPWASLIMVGAKTPAEDIAEYMADTARVALSAQRGLDPA